MYHKIPFALAVISVGLSSVYANPVQKDALANRLTRQIVQSNVSYEADPYLSYQKQLAAIKQPSYQTLRPLFDALTIYNADFAQMKTQEECSQLAHRLAQTTWTGWNNYRKIGMLEIFDRYFPQENKDEKIALLEYNIKINLLSGTKWHYLMVFESMNDEYVSAFKKSYNEFIRALQEETSYRPKEVIKFYIPLIEAYKQLKQDFPATASLIKGFVFEKPFVTGWGRTTTIEGLRHQIGIQEMTEGWHVYSPEELQKRYGVLAEDAAVFAEFVKKL